jgi:hypothetical protein
MEDEDLPGCKISDIPPDGYVFEDVMSVGIWSKIFRAVEGSSSPVAMKAVIACPKTMPLIEAEMEAVRCVDPPSLPYFLPTPSPFLPVMRVCMCACMGVII